MLCAGRGGGRAAEAGVEALIALDRMPGWLG